MIDDALCDDVDETLVRFEHSLSSMGPLGIAITLRQEILGIRGVGVLLMPSDNFCPLPRRSHRTLHALACSGLCKLIDGARNDMIRRQPHRRVE
jgi:hypothetical protein